MLQYTQVFDRLLSLGINQDDSADNIGEGFVEDAINADVDATTLTLRKGYDRRFGDVPLRVAGFALIDATPDLISISFEDYVDLTNVVPGPIYVHGKYVRSSVVSTINTRYSTFTLADRVTLASSATSEFVSARYHTIDQLYCLIGIYDLASCEMVMTDSIGIDPATLNLTIYYGVTADREVSIVSYTPEAGNYYQDAALASAATTTIDAATHGLSNYNIIPMIYDATTSPDQTITPDVVTVDSAGLFSMTFVGTPPVTLNVALVSTTDTVSGTTVGGTTSTSVVISGATSKYLMAACYEETVSTGLITLI